MLIFLIKFLFISCTGSSLLLGLFSNCSEPGLLSSFRVQASHCRGFLLQSTSSRARGFSTCGSWAVEQSSTVVAQGLSCSSACGIFPDQGPNVCLLHWQADSLPLSYQGSPMMVNFMCQLHWAMGYPDIGSNIVLDILLKVFLDEINI